VNELCELDACACACVCVCVEERVGCLDAAGKIKKWLQATYLGSVHTNVLYSMAFISFFSFFQDDCTDRNVCVCVCVCLWLCAYNLACLRVFQRKN